MPFNTAVINLSFTRVPSVMGILKFQSNGRLSSVRVHRTKAFVNKGQYQYILPPDKLPWSETVAAFTRNAAFRIGSYSFDAPTKSFGFIRVNSGNESFFCREIHGDGNCGTRTTMRVILLSGFTAESRHMGLFPDLAEETSDWNLRLYLDCILFHQNLHFCDSGRSSCASDGTEQ